MAKKLNYQNNQIIQLFYNSQSRARPTCIVIKLLGVGGCVGGCEGIPPLGADFQFLVIACDKICAQVGLGDAAYQASRLHAGDFLVVG